MFSLTSRVVARYVWASKPRSFFARREERPDLYRELQRQFLQFQSSLFDLAKLGEIAPDKDKALDLIADLPELLDSTIGLPHEQVLEAKYKTGLEKIQRGLDELEALIGKGSLQRGQVATLRNRMKMARVALASIVKHMDRYAKVMGKQEQEERIRAEKERIRAEKLRALEEKARLKAEKLEQRALENAKWCEENCPACSAEIDEREYALRHARSPMPAKVDELFDEIKENNPGYSDEQAWATAWSVFCKHVEPGSDSCHLPTSEYLKGKSARNERPKMERLQKIARTLTALGRADLAREVALASLEMKSAGKSRTASWEGKLVGKDFRLTWSYNNWNLEELPAKGKRKLRVADMPTFLEIGSTSGVDTSPFIHENILRDASISTSDSYDGVKAKLQAAYQDAAEMVLASAGAQARTFQFILDNKWSEDQVHFLKVTPENVEPFTAQAKDFTVDCKWTEFSAYSPSSDFERSDAHYTEIESSAPAAARKLYQMLKADPNALRSISWGDFDDWLKANKIGFKFNFSSWR